MADRGGSAGATGVVAGSNEPDLARLDAEIRDVRRNAAGVARGVAADVGEVADPASAAAQALELIGELESLRNAAAGLQAALAVRVDRRRRQVEAEQGVPARRRGKGVAAEVALARRVGISVGSRLLGLGKILTAEMPHTFARLAEGELSEWRATLLARETACLQLQDRQAVDRELCAEPRTLHGKGDRAVVAAAKQAAYRRDAESVVRRAELAESERRVWLRPAPDQMAYLTALLPLTQAVATYAALTKAAGTARATGDADGRNAGQLMADELVTRITGLANPTRVPIRVNLLMTDAALFTGDNEPGIVPGYGPVPAGWCREQITRGGAPAWIRRLYVAPTDGSLVAMDSHAREVPDGLAEFIRLRDQDSCRVAWCDAPARHIDHVVPVAAGGATTATNLEGNCEAHNYAKEAPGWSMRPIGPRGGRWHAGPTIQIRTPAGHTYTSRPPEPPRGRRHRVSRRRHVERAGQPSDPDP